MFYFINAVEKIIVITITAFWSWTFSMFLFGDTICIAMLMQKCPCGHTPMKWSLSLGSVFNRGNVSITVEGGSKCDWIILTAFSSDPGCRAPVVPTGLVSPVRSQTPTGRSVVMPDKSLIHDVSMVTGTGIQTQGSPFDEPDPESVVKKRGIWSGTQSNDGLVLPDSEVELSFMLVNWTRAVDIRDAGWETVSWPLLFVSGETVVFIGIVGADLDNEWEWQLRLIRESCSPNRCILIAWRWWCNLVGEVSRTRFTGRFEIGEYAWSDRRFLEERTEMDVSMGKLVVELFWTMFVVFIVSAVLVLFSEVKCDQSSIDLALLKEWQLQWQSGEGGRMIGSGNDFVWCCSVNTACGNKELILSNKEWSCGRWHWPKLSVLLVVEIGDLDMGCDPLGNTSDPVKVEWFDSFTLPGSVDFNDSRLAWSNCAIHEGSDTGFSSKFLGPVLVIMSTEDDKSNAAVESEGSEIRGIQCSVDIKEASEQRRLENSLTRTLESLSTYWLESHVSTEAVNGAGISVCSPVSGCETFVWLFTSDPGDRLISRWAAVFVTAVLVGLTTPIRLLLLLLSLLWVPLPWFTSGAHRSMRFPSECECTVRTVPVILDKPFCMKTIWSSRSLMLFDSFVTVPPIPGSSLCGNVPEDGESKFEVVPASESHSTFAFISACVQSVSTGSGDGHEETALFEVSWHILIKFLKPINW